ncbi:uncharacterized protein [Palaemon carinicauda]|uniref:uncharacterized protein n=1 Tax=Palaemon carinicauda TaxID=392227 RepID=UPI0035B608C1
MKIYSNTSGKKCELELNWFCLIDNTIDKIIFVQNMSNHSKEPQNSSNNVARKPLICYICDKIVKDYRLSTHLLFGSLQCKDCDQKFRRCRDFESFRKSKDKIESGSCGHQTLKWTRDPAKYLERKLLNDIERCKPDHRPSTREVVKALISYVNSLKPLESKSPWRRAIEKLKKLISQKKDTFKTRDREGKDLHGSPHHGEEKHSDYDVTYPCKNRNNTNGEWKHCNGFSQELRGEPEHEHYLDVPNFKDEYETFYEVQSTNGYMDECMVPQYTEEVTIPQTECEFDDQCSNEFQECDNSTEVPLGNEQNDKILLTVEEVYSDIDSDTSPMTLIIDNVNGSIDVAEEIPIAQEDSEASTEFCESSTQQPRDNLKNNKLEYFMNEDDKTSDTEKQCSETSEDDEELFEPSECETKNSRKKLWNTAHIPLEHEKVKSIKSKATLVNHVYNGNTRYKKETKNRTFSSLGEHSPPMKYEDAKMDNVKHQNKKKFSRLDYENSKSRRTKRSSYKDSELEREDEKLLRCYRRNGRTFKGTKYNLRSRRSNSSESFLQKLDAAEKKKLWEKLLPTARKLRKLSGKSNRVSPSTFIIPLDSEDNNDDFLIEVLLSQVLDVPQPKSTTDFSSEDDEEDDYNNCEEITLLLNQVRRVVRQFTYSLEKSRLSAAGDSSNLSVNCSKSNYAEPTDSVERRKHEKSKPEYLNHVTVGKDLGEKKPKTFYIRPPSDGNYYVVNYPSQPLITECPMCYFRVFPSMFSLNLVTNLATTQCVGCMLTIYVVHEPGKNNSLPRIVFRRDDSSEEDQEVAKPARFKNRTKNVKRKVSVRSFFK